MLCNYRSGFRASLEWRDLFPQEGDERGKKTGERDGKGEVIFPFQGHFGTLSLCLGINPVRHWCVYARARRRRAYACMSAHIRTDCVGYSVTRLVTLPTTASSPCVCNLSMPGTATRLPPIISLWVSAVIHRSAQCHHIQSGSAQRESTEQNRISHLWFEVQKPISQRKKFKISLPFLIEQFLAPVQSIQMSVIIPDKTNQFFPRAFLLCSLCVSPKVRKRLFETTKGPANGGRGAVGRVNELATVIGMVSFYEVSSSDNATDAHRKCWLWLINLDGWDKSGLLLTSLKCSNCLFSLSWGNNRMIGTFCVS